MFYFFGTVQFLFHFKNSLAQIESGTVQDAECFFQFPADIFRYTGPGKTDTVKADATCRLTIGNYEGRNVLYDFRQAADHAVAADLDKLMNAGNTADDDPIFNGNVTGKAGTVAHDDVVADDAVVGNMGTGLEQAVIADSRFFPFPRRRADRHEFPENRAVADDKKTLFTVIF